jgi:hypothetical protein
VTELPLEKNFAHAMFCQQIDAVADIDLVRKLAKDLHVLYLELAKKDFGGFCGGK